MNFIIPPYRIQFPSLSVLGVTIASTVASMMVMPAAEALILTPVSDIPVKYTWEKLFDGEGRAGGPGRADYEYAIGPEGANVGADVLYRDWTNGEEVPWHLFWNGTTADLTIGDSTIYYTPTLSSDDTLFNGLYFLAQAKGVGSKLSEGTEMFFSVLEINGIAQSGLAATGIAPATGNSLQEFLFKSDTHISSLSGIARMSWGEGDVNPNRKNAKGRVTFKLKGYDTGDRLVSVPEPSMTLGLLAFASLGLLKSRSHN